MIRHPTLTPEQFRVELQNHLDEVMFVLIAADTRMTAIGKVIALREHIEQMLDTAVLPPTET